MTSGKTFVVGVDTNILLNFGAFRLLKWKDIFPDATAIILLVAAKVQSEMDVHKDRGTGYVRRRAQEFQKLVREAEDRDYVVDYSDADIPVRCVMLDRPRTDTLDASQFDLASPDELIVAQYHHAREKFGDVIVVANDANPIRTARRAGMQAVRPDGWTADRSEPEDESTRRLRERVKELERRAGALPSLEIEALEPVTKTMGVCRISSDFNLAVYQSNMRDGMMSAFPLPTRSELIAKHGKADWNTNFYALGGRHGYTDVQLAVWEGDVEAFYRHFDNLSQDELLERIERLASVRILELSLANNGSAAEESVRVDFETRANARFVSANDFHDLNDWGLEEPEAEDPNSPFEIPSLPTFVDRLPSDEQAIHLHEEDETIHSFRCKTFLHGVCQTVRVFIVADHPSEDSRILVSIRAKNLMDPIIREVRLTPVSTAFDEAAMDRFMADRLDLMPGHQADVIKAVLRAKNGR